MGLQEVTVVYWDGYRTLREPPPYTENPTSDSL